jgi:hypothetical protein
MTVDELDDAGRSLAETRGAKIQGVGAQKLVPMTDESRQALLELDSRLVSADKRVS